MDEKLRQPFINATKHIKNNALLNLDEAWTIISGDLKERGKLNELYRNVSYLFRGIDILSNAVARMPFQIEDENGKIIDQSKDYQNALGFLPNPGYLFGLIEAALQIWGYAYNFRVVRNTFINDVKVMDDLRYLLPTTVNYEIDDETGEITFERNVNGKPVEYTTEEIVYYWMADPFVELGTPTGSPVQAAAAAAGIKMSVNDFGIAFFARGAIKATLLTTKGNVVEAERSKL